MKHWMKYIRLPLALSLLLVLAACNAEPFPDSNPIQTRAPSIIHGDYAGYDVDAIRRGAADIIFTGKVTDMTTKHWDVTKQVFDDNFRITQREAYWWRDWDKFDPDLADQLLEEAELGSELYTLYEVEVDHVYYGEYGEQTISIAARGGIVNGVQYVQEGALPIEYGRSYLFVVRDNGLIEGITHFMSPHQSAYDLDPEVRAQQSYGHLLSYEILMDAFG